MNALNKYFEPPADGVRTITEENYKKLVHDFAMLKEAKWLIKAKIDNKIAELDLKVQELLG